MIEGGNASGSTGIIVVNLGGTGQQTDADGQSCSLRVAGVTWS